MKRILVSCDFSQTSIGRSEIMNSKKEKPNEIPFPERTPETTPAVEPEPKTWPERNPEVLPGKDPDRTTAPIEIPPPPESILW